jgi:cytochrome c oxidase subunit 3
MSDAAVLLSDTQQSYRSRLGMWVFLATELMFIGPLAFAYVVGRDHAPVGFAQASHLTDLTLGTLNTVVLLTSSLSMAVAVEGIKANALAFARRALWVTALLGIVFLSIKASEYAKDFQQNLFPHLGFHAKGVEDQSGAALFFFLYFFATFVHAIHLIIGICLVLKSSLYRQASNAAIRREVEAVGLYWHFVDIVWVFLFPALYLVERSS